MSTRPRKELKYLKTHEWARRQQDSDIITVGLSEYAIKQLDDIVFIELPVVGSRVVKECEFCAIESVKAASGLYAPVTGEIVEVNENLTDNLELFTQDAYGQAWIVKIKADDMADFEKLIGAEDYEKQLKE